MARNILVVEDDRNISDLIRMYLEKEGFADPHVLFPVDRAVALYDGRRTAARHRARLPGAAGLLRACLLYTSSSSRSSR